VSVRESIQDARERTDDTVVDAHLRQALRAVDRPTGALAECAVCGRVGLPERIATHDC